MIDFKYHIVSLIAIFLALGLGILIGSTIVSDDLMVGQQEKMIDGLEERFFALKEEQTMLMVDNANKTRLISEYEKFGQALLSPIVKDHLHGYKLAIIITGGQDIPSGLLNTLSTAGAEVMSKTVLLNNIKLDDSELNEKIKAFYGLDEKVSLLDLRRTVASSVGIMIASNADSNVINFLEENKLLKFNGTYDNNVDGVIIIGGSENYDKAYMNSFDSALIDALLKSNKNAFGVESSEVKISYMEHYQSYNITTIDNIDLSPGQIALVLSMEGEPGDYGIKETAKRFIPSLPIDYLQ